jgi:hypothetical protein
MTDAVCARCLETPPCDCDADERDAFECASMADAACAAVERTVLVCALAELADASEALLDLKWCDADAAFARHARAMLTAREVLRDYQDVASAGSTPTLANDAGQSVPNGSPDADRLPGVPPEGDAN